MLDLTQMDSPLAQKRNSGVSRLLFDEAELLPADRPVAVGCSFSTRASVSQVDVSLWPRDAWSSSEQTCVCGELRTDQRQGYGVVVPAPSRSLVYGLFTFAAAGSVGARLSPRPRRGSPRHRGGSQMSAIAHMRIWNAGARLRMRSAGASRWAPMAAAMGGLLLVYAGWQLFRWPAGHRELFGDVAFYPVDLAAIGAAWVASRCCVERPRLRWGWRLVAIAFACYFAGDVIWTVYEVVGSKPYPSAADVLYLLFYPVMLGGLLCFAEGRREITERVRLTLDLAVVAIAGTAVVTFVVLGPTIVQSGPDPLQTAISIAYPVGDVVLLVGLSSVLLRRSAGSSARALQFIAVGLLLFVAGDLAYGYITLHSTYHGGDPIDSLWMVSVALFAIAGAAQGSPERAVGDREEGYVQRASWAPVIAVAVGFGLLLFSERNLPLLPDESLVIASVLLAGLVCARQFLAQRDLVRTQGRLSYQSLHDALTGLPNRALVIDRAEQMLARSRRGRTPMAALYVDIDGFKHVNDSLGHAAGDELLRVVAARLSGVIREADTVGRLGGDEFVVLLENSTLDAGPELVAERICEVLAQPVDLHARGQTVSVTASVGVALGQRGSADELLRDADFA